jgi:hypothetical protein
MPNDGCVEDFGNSISVSEIQAAEAEFFSAFILTGCTPEEITKDGYKPCVNSFLSSYAPLITEVIQTAIPGSIGIDVGDSASDSLNIGICRAFVDARAGLDKVTGLNKIVVDRFIASSISGPSNDPPLWIVDATIGVVVGLPCVGASGFASASLVCDPPILPTVRVSANGRIGTNANANGVVRLGGKFIISTDTNELCLKVATEVLDINRCNLFGTALSLRLCVLGICLPLGFLIISLFGPILDQHLPEH